MLTVLHKCAQVRTSGAQVEVKSATRGRLTTCALYIKYSAQVVGPYPRACRDWRYTSGKGVAGESVHKCCTSGVYGAGTEAHKWCTSGAQVIAQVEHSCQEGPRKKTKRDSYTERTSATDIFKGK